jgi:hypothetical protein
MRVSRSQSNSPGHRAGLFVFGDYFNVERVRSLMWAVMEAKDGTGYSVEKLLDGESPEEIEVRLAKIYKQSFTTEQAARATAEKLTQIGKPRWTH